MFLLSLIAAVILPSAYAELILTKTLSTEHPVVSRPLSVTVQFYNAGKTSCLNVKYLDTTYVTERFKWLDGHQKFSVGSIPPGHTEEYTFSVLPKRAGNYVDAPGRVEYLIEQSEDRKMEGNVATKQIGRSSFRGEMKVLTEVEYGKVLGRHNTDWILWAVVALGLSSGLPYFLYRKEKSRLL